jgi:rifampicin phosphotransferase
MVFPDVSGILFTADPIDGRRHIVSIDAGFGLGEALVSGLVSADLYKLDKRTNEIVERKIAKKTLAIWPTPEGGTRQEAISGDRQTAPSLADRQAKELATLGARIEAHYQAPQDVEWCIEAGKLYVVQSRPITTLYPLPEPTAPGTQLRVYISFSHAQVMTDALPPYAQSIWRHLFPFGRDDSGVSHTMLAAGGRLYLDPSDLLRVSPLGKAFARILNAVDALMSAAVADVIERPEFGSGTGSKLAALRNVVSFLGPVLARAMGRMWLTRPEGNAGRALAFVNASIGKARVRLDAATPGAQRYEVARLLHSKLFLNVFLQIVPSVLSGILGLVILRKLLAGRGVDREITMFAQGLDGNVTTEMDLQLGDIADVARAHPAVVFHLKNTDARQALQSVRSVEGGDAFDGAMQAFLAKYGVRGGSEIDIARPRWNEDPTPLIQMLVGNLARGEPGTHRAHHAQLKKQGLEAAERMIRASSRLKRPLVRRLVRVCRQNLAIREHPKFLLIQWLGLMKRVTTECAEMLVREGRLGAKEDVFFLTIPELSNAMRGKGPASELGNEPTLEELVSRRKEEHQRNRKLSPPRVMTSEGEIVTKKHAGESLPANAIAGSAASPGVAEGKAKVVLDPSTAILEAGEILVAPFTDPGWTPLFINAKGLVMEVGGLMTHGSVVAREYGIPAVVCVPDATKKIQTGQHIRVNGDEGFVEIL